MKNKIEKNNGRFAAAGKSEYVSTINISPYANFVLAFHLIKKGKSANKILTTYTLKS